MYTYLGKMDTCLNSLIQKDPIRQGPFILILEIDGVEKRVLGERSVPYFHLHQIQSHSNCSIHRQVLELLLHSQDKILSIQGTAP